MAKKAALLRGKSQGEFQITHLPIRADAGSIINGLVVEVQLCARQSAQRKRLVVRDYQPPEDFPMQSKDYFFFAAFFAAFLAAGFAAVAAFFTAFFAAFFATVCSSKQS